MNRFVLAAALVMVGCESGERLPGDSSRPRTSYEAEAQDVARHAFEKWNAAGAAGDSEGTWNGMTLSLRQHWLWLRLRDKTDAITRDHLTRLDGEERKVLDKWYEAHERANPQRAQSLPERILLGQWLFDLYRLTFVAARNEVIGQAKLRRVIEVYLGDDGGVTILAQVGGEGGPKEMYDMQFEGDTWKVNLCKPGLHRKK